MELKIVVYYTCVNRWNVPCFEELLFDTEEEADRFIDKIKNRMNVTRIIKTVDWKLKGETKMIPKNIIVKYSGFDKNGLYYSNVLEFRTERDADLFILDMKKLMFGVQSYTKIITWEKKEETKNENQS